MNLSLVFYVTFKDVENLELSINVLILRNDATKTTGWFARDYKVLTSFSYQVADENRCFNNSELTNTFQERGGDFRQHPRREGGNVI